MKKVIFLCFLLFAATSTSYLSIRVEANELCSDTECLYYDGQPTYEVGCSVYLPCTEPEEETTPNSSNPGGSPLPPSYERLGDPTGNGAAPVSVINPEDMCQILGATCLR